MKVAELSMILQDLDPEMEVKLYLYSPCGINTGHNDISVLRVESYSLSDVLISRKGNSVLLSSLQK